MNVFLTGGTGFIGRQLTRCLLGRGWGVVALVRNPDAPQARALAGTGVRCARGDVTDRESMRAAMTGADVVIHNAAWFEVGVDRAARTRMHAINVTGTDNVLGLAQELGIPRTVYVSTTLCYGASGAGPCDETYRRRTPYRSWYEQTKAEAHELALGYVERGLPLVIVCPNQVVGANDHSALAHFLRLYLIGLLPPVAWAPDIPGSFVHVDDVAEGIVLAAQRGRIGETYLLAGESISRRDYVAMWAEHPGGLKVRFWIPSWLAWLTFAPLEPLQRTVGLTAFMSRETVAASVPLNYSAAKAMRELGWSHLPARAMWQRVIQEEMQLLRRRTRRDVVSRLKPLEVVE
jgi:dihydroflavonol-4-reductase